jgi:hypothetical protein
MTSHRKGRGPVGSKYTDIWHLSGLAYNIDLIRIRSIKYNNWKDFRCVKVQSLVGIQISHELV